MLVLRVFHWFSLGHGGLLGFVFWAPLRTSKISLPLSFNYCSYFICAFIYVFCPRALVILILSGLCFLNSVSVDSSLIISISFPFFSIIYRKCHFSSLTVKELLHLYSPKIISGPLKATARLMWPPPPPRENECDTPALCCVNMSQVYLPPPWFHLIH